MDFLIQQLLLGMHFLQCPSEAFQSQPLFSGLRKGIKGDLMASSGIIDYTIAFSTIISVASTILGTSGVRKVMHAILFFLLPNVSSSSESIHN